jgi:hypothetical protein
MCKTIQFIGISKFFIMMITKQQVAFASVASHRQHSNQKWYFLSLLEKASNDWFDLRALSSCECWIGRLIKCGAIFARPELIRLRILADNFCCKTAGWCMLIMQFLLEVIASFPHARDACRSITTSASSESMRVRATPPKMFLPEHEIG